jgi:hypothetical protein
MEKPRTGGTETGLLRFLWGEPVTGGKHCHRSLRRVQKTQINPEGRRLRVGALQITNQFTKWQRCTDSSGTGVIASSSRGMSPQSRPTSVHRAPVHVRAGASSYVASASGGALFVASTAPVTLSSLRRLAVRPASR